MKYVLHSPLSKTASTPKAEIEKLSAKWLEHPFYKSDLVLGLDIGIEGIGIWLRKGPTPLFAQTIAVELPEATCPTTLLFHGETQADPLQPLGCVVALCQ